MKVVFAGDLSLDWLPGIKAVRLLPHFLRGIFSPDEDIHGSAHDSQRKSFSDRWLRANIDFQTQQIGRGIQTVLSAADFVCVNLECPLSTRGESLQSKKYTLRASPEFVRVLRRLHISHVNLANNHILDYGPEALADTRQYLEQSGISYMGLDEGGIKAEPAILEGDGAHVAILNYVEPSIIDPDPALYFKHDIHPSPLEPERVLEEVRRNTTDGPVIVVFHWGVEWSFLENGEQRRIAHEVIDAGATAVIGHHTHLPAGIEEYHGGLIAYGLGNLFMALPPFTAARAAQRLIVELDVRESGLAGYRLLPLSNDRDGFPVISDMFKVSSLVAGYEPEDIPDVSDAAFDAYSALASAEVVIEEQSEPITSQWSDDYLLNDETALYRLPLGPGWRAKTGEWAGCSLAREFLGREFCRVNVSHLKGRITVGTRFNIDQPIKKMVAVIGYPEVMRLNIFFSCPRLELLVNGRKIREWHPPELTTDRIVETISVDTLDESVAQIEVRVTGSDDDYGLLCWNILGI